MEKKKTEKDIEEVVLVALRNLNDDGTDGDFGKIENLTYQNRCCKHITLCYHNGKNGKIKNPVPETGEVVEVFPLDYYRDKKSESIVVCSNSETVKKLRDHHDLMLVVSYRDGAYTHDIMNIVTRNFPVNGSLNYPKSFKCVIRNYVKYKDGTYGWY